MNPTPLPDTLEKALEQFDYRFCSMYGIKVFSSEDGKLVMRHADVDELKSFLSQVWLASKEARDREIRSMVEGMKVEYTPKDKPETEWKIDNLKRRGRNEVLDDLLAKLK